MAEVLPIERTPGCRTCDEGKLETFMLDDSGCGVGDSQKLPGHAVGDWTWHCCHNLKPLEDCPLCGTPPQMCVCGGPDWAHQPGEVCFHGEDECEDECTEFEWDGCQASWG